MAPPHSYSSPNLSKLRELSANFIYDRQADILPLISYRPPTVEHRKQSSSANSPQNAQPGLEGSGGVALKPFWSFLPSPATVRLIGLVLLWYSCSSLTSNIGKQLLVEFNYPISLTVAQFGFVGLYGFAYAKLLSRLPDVKKPVITPPSRNIVRIVGVLAVFNILAHLLTAVAISRVSVSLAHTVKALSPLFTVIFSKLFLGSRYTAQVYISLAPLISGVILACTTEISYDTVGFLAALGSSLIFVGQNIYSKKVFTDGRMDELNLLFYSAAIAFVLMMPMWITTDGMELFNSGFAELTWSTVFLFFLNGITHFGQNIFAFSLMTMVSPVTYSIASLLKRVFIIATSIVYFGTTVTVPNMIGMALTFIGLYAYNRTRSHKESPSSSRHELPHFVSSTKPNHTSAGDAGFLLRRENVA